jgi:hypothetical protein
MRPSASLAVPVTASLCRLRHGNPNRNDQHCQVYGRITREHRDAHGASRHTRDLARMRPTTAREPCGARGIGMIALTPTYSRRRQGSAHRLPARAVAERARCQERAVVSPVHRRRSGAPILSGQAIGGAALCGEPCTGGAHPSGETQSMVTGASSLCRPMQPTTGRGLGGTSCAAGHGVWGMQGCAPDELAWRAVGGASGPAAARSTGWAGGVGAPRSRTSCADFGAADPGGRALWSVFRCSDGRSPGQCVPRSVQVSRPRGRSSPWWNAAWLHGHPSPTTRRRCPSHVRWRVMTYLPAPLPC